MKHMLSVESCSVYQQTGKCLDALHKILHSGGCDKTQRYCLYEGIEGSYVVFQNVVRRVHAISYIILMRFLKLFRAFS